MADCLICTRIAMIEQGTNSFFVTELESGYVVIGDHQFFRGYTLLLSRWHARELHELDWDRRTAFLRDMALTAEAVCRAFAPRKLNYELLGNADEHMHWHLFPRHADDPNPTRPIWAVDAAVTRSHAARPSADALGEMTARLRREIEALLPHRP